MLLYYWLSVENLPHASMFMFCFFKERSGNRGVIVIGMTMLMIILMALIGNKMMTRKLGEGLGQAILSMAL